MCDFKRSERFLLNEVFAFNPYSLSPDSHNTFEEATMPFFHHEYLLLCPLFSKLAFKTTSPTELLLGIASPFPSFAPEISLLNLKIVNSAATILVYSLKRECDD